MSPRTSNRLPRRLAALTFTACLALVPALAGAAGLDGSAGAARFAFPTESDFLVIEYSMHHDELAENDPTPLLRIYGDGSVLVHVPRYMKGAGDYRLQLSRERLRALVSSLASYGVLDFDGERTKQVTAAAEIARHQRDGSFVHISDTSWTRLRVRLEQYDPLGTGLDADGLDRRIAWPNLGWHLEHYPQIESLQGLAAGERLLRSFLDHQSLTAVDGPED